MSKIGPREQMLRDQKAAALKPARLSLDPVIKRAQLAHAKAQVEKTTKPVQPEPDKPEESTMDATATETTPKSPKRAKKAAKPAKKAKGAKKAAAKAERKARVASAPKGGIRPGSKLELVVGLLRQPGGTTTEEAKAKTGWPSISMPQQAKAAGLELKIKKIDGVNHYSVA